MITLAVTVAALATRIQGQAVVDEKYAQAAALGYVADAKRVDVKKFPKFVAGQHCANCTLYQGKATDKTAGCTLFPGKLVAGAGWCMPGRRRRERPRRPRGIAVTQRGTSFLGNKAAMPSKPCVVCGLAMSWRRRWAKNWADVKYCSDACRRNKTARG